jgi:DNA-binding winged helix-turn-helix (wHTH) protein
MIYTTLPDFINNSEFIINNTVLNEELAEIETDNGSVVLMTKEQYDCFLDYLGGGSSEVKWSSYIRRS